MTVTRRLGARQRGACSAEDHRDTMFYEAPHQVGHDGLLSGWVMRPET